MFGLSNFSSAALATQEEPCKFCNRTNAEFERGVQKYRARIAKLIVMWDAAEAKKRGRDPAQQASPEQLARWQAAAYGYNHPAADPYCGGVDQQNPFL